VPQPTIVAGTLRRAVRSLAFARIPGGRHMECAYYFVDGTWNVPTTLIFALTFVGSVYLAKSPNFLGLRDSIGIASVFI
jgi:hypothetical protein